VRVVPGRYIDLVARRGLMPPPRAWIGVVGPGEADAPELELAEEVGAAVADAGAGLVCGGLGGVMEAACRGARSRGGLTLGLLPGLDREAANGWVIVAVPTGLGEARNALVVRAADAVVAIGGGWGTLSEIALALKTGVPVVGLGTWEPALDGEPAGLGTSEPALDGEPAGGVVTASEPRAAVAEALRLSSQSRR
jgi:uncharacterized protein (TIGR00725 family)